MSEPTGTNFQVSTEDVTAAAGQVDAAVRDIEGELDSLRAFVAATGDYWKGADQVAFGNLMTDFHANADSLKQTLDQIASGLRGNAANYGETGSANAGVFKSTHGSLPPAKFR